MEISTKQKVIVFAVMGLIFAASVFIKGVVAAPDGDERVNDGIVIENGENGAGDADGEGGSVGSGTGDGTETAGDPENELYIVDVEGAVVFPGVVKIEEGSRVYEAIEKAGGMLETADSRSVNLAEVIEDGTVIYIPYEGEVTEEGEGGKDVAGGASGMTDNGGRVNINKADRTTLMTLPGIGEAYASAIIEYREKNGKFNSKEDIKKVSGIGDAKYAKMEDLICV